MEQYGEHNGGFLTAQREDGLVHHLAPVETFYKTCPQETVQKAAEKLVPMIASPLVTPTKYCGWLDFGIPITCVVCLNDNALPRTIQGKMMSVCVT